MKQLYSAYLGGVSLCMVSFFLFGLAGVLSSGSSVAVEWEVGVSSLEFLVDFYSALFLWVVSLITGSVLMFGSGYMKGDGASRRFFYSVLSFVGAMVAMVLGSNLFTSMVGWDGLGVTSFYLVQYYQNQEAYDASLLTGLSNRVGDVFMVVVVCEGLGVSTSGWYSCGSLTLVLASMTKSAQFPFSAWLPAAMSAPTPVSSLVHSSTLVTAGVYLLIRYGSSEVSDFLLITSLLTMNVAGSSAVFEDDLKKVVALSTLGHLSFMMLALSLGMSDLAMLHCIVHALGKAGMFVCVGCLMSAQGGSQDGRSVNWWFSSLDSAYWGLFLSSVVLTGVPFFSAGVSKEMVLHACLSAGGSVIVPVLLFSGVFFSFLYTSSLWWSLLSEKVGEVKSVSVEDPLAITALVGSLVGGGFVVKEMFFGEVCEMYENCWFGLSGMVGSASACLLSAVEDLKFNKKPFFFESMWFLESVSGQVPSMFMERLSAASVYTEGWSEILYPGSGLYTEFFCWDLASKRSLPVFATLSSGFLIILFMLVAYL